jgi:ribosomal protein S18 acetylase RimI-like enzyme
MPYLRKMELSDVNQVVNVHLSSFQGFFLTFLGPEFLSLLYTFMVSSSDGVGYVFMDEGERIVGFVCGSTEPSGFYRRFFKKQWLHIVLATLWLVVRNPSIVPRLVWRVLYPPQPSTDPATATLMSIAVLPEHQNKGLGKVLVLEFLSEMQRRGIQRVNLTTDKEGNDAGNAFYHRLGFRLARSFVTPEGRWMNEYVITLSAGDANA